MHEINILKGWLLFSSRELESDKKRVSLPGFDVKDALPTDIPSTVMAALVRNKVYRNVYFSDNLDHISVEPFKVSWWYRKTFFLDAIDDSHYYRLIFEGLNDKANIWLNGVCIADFNEVQGCFRMFEFEVTEHLQQGENALALEVFPPQPGDLSIGFVDWNPWPPDQNMGIWRPVKLLQSGAVSLKNGFVKSDLDVETLETAALTVSAEITNHAQEPVSGLAEIKIENIVLNQEFSLQPNETRKLCFHPSDYADLNINTPGSGGRFIWVNPTFTP
ncbi:MAG: hypothetical protein U5R06_03020 [candidate division KSB1 bacterium]|nr:hypothetical protein [candidate division KSB1 bacterium]